MKTAFALVYAIFLVAAFGIPLSGAAYASASPPSAQDSAQSGLGLPTDPDMTPDLPQSIEGAARDAQQDRTATAQNNRQDTTTAVLAEKVKEQDAQLAILNAKNAFWLQIVQTFMPLLSAIGIAVVAWLQVKAQRERSLMAQSINGLKTELVATTRAAAFMEGAHLQAVKDSPDAPSLVTARGIELSEEARQASLSAHRLASTAAGEKGPSGVMGIPTPKSGKGEPDHTDPTTPA